MVELAQLGPADSHDLIKAFEEAPAPSSIVELKQSLADTLGGRRAETAKTLVDEALAVSATLGERNYSPPIIARSIAQSDALELSEPQRQALQETLSGVLGSQALRTLGKANELASEHERVMADVRVLTDIRPVFADPDTRPLGALVGQRLRISFWHAGRLDDLEVALTANQVEALVTELRRAQTKAATLDSMLGAIPLRTFDTELVENL